MDKQAVKDLLVRYRAGNCTKAEQHLVESWIVYHAADPLDLSDAQLLEDLLDIRLRLERDLQARETTKAYTMRKWLPYAAAIALLLSVGIWLSNDRWLIRHQQPAAETQIVDIAPGGNRATLTLEDGRTIALSPEQEGIIVGKEIAYSDGTAVLDAAENATQGGPTWLQLATPKGGTYQITLSDGTRVWLNSASTLTYPNRFMGAERIVEISGEAYFEVTKNPNKPFKVISKDQELAVLGTAFNILAYGDETVVKTTLVEGSVRVTSNTHHSATILTPGQQSTVSGTGIEVNEVNVAACVGWKEGYFIFNGTELFDAMKQLSRWYDVEVVYEGPFPPTPFYGKISMGDTLAEVLAILKEGKVNFRIEKREGINRLIVIP
jgi:transmembrane sensor